MPKVRKKKRPKNICKCGKKMPLEYDDCPNCDGFEYYQCPKCYKMYDADKGEELP